MSVHHLEPIFRPRSVAVIGASDRQPGVGYSVLRNLREAGFTGEIYPVNPRRSSVQGLPAYSAVHHIPVPPDLAIVCTPAATVPDLVEECGAAGVGGMIVLSAGFRERGESGRALEEAVLTNRKRYHRMRILGPNCLGLLGPHQHLNASFASHRPRPGNVAVLSQSGALCTAFLDWAQQEAIGFSYFVSVGNMADVTFADVIDYLAVDAHTRSLILYIESIPDAPAFLSAARAFTRTRPIVVFKSGRYAESAQAATTHTGALAGADAVYDAAFERAGIVRVDELTELFDTAELLARGEPPRGSRLAVVTNAGGPGVIAADALIRGGGRLAQLSPCCITELNRALPEYWSHGNPVDLLGDATPERYCAAVQPVLADEGVDAVLVILTPQSMTDPTAVAARVAELAKTSRKPLLTAWMGGEGVVAGQRALNEAHVPTYATPEQAIKAFLSLVQYRQRQELLLETPRIPPTWNPSEVSHSADAVPRHYTRGDRREPVPQLIAEARRKHSPMLSEEASKSLLDHYGIPTVPTFLADSKQAAVRIADRLGYPVVLKIASRQITHKTEVGGVALDLHQPREVEQAWDQVLLRVRERAPEAVIDGMTLQRMISGQAGVELILGCRHDSTFGTVLLAGAGGIAAECYRDRSLGLPPINERLATHMLRSLRIWPLLQGYRGRPPVALEQLTQAMIRFSWLVADCPELEEFDINPLLATPDGVVALDARAKVRQFQSPVADVRPHLHLAIRPYPEHLRRTVRLTSGQEFVLRPIRHEDEPLWQEMLSRCSPETIRARFQGMIRSDVHELAARFCCVDYDREIAIVAESRAGGITFLAGVARLAADADHETAELAILVADAWQGQRLGIQLLRFCLDLAESWGLKELIAQCAVDNLRMLRLLSTFDFKRTGSQDGLAYFSRTLST